MPGGSTGGGSGANRSSSASAGGCAAGGDAGFCAWAGSRPTPKNKTIAATATGKASLRTRFIVSPLESFVFLQHCLHGPDLGPLSIVGIGGKVKQLGILPRACGVEQVFHHDQRAIMVLNHSGQE